MNKSKPTNQFYAALQNAYDAFNHALFDGKLDNSLITLQRRANTFGYMSYNRFISTNDNQIYTHELALNPEYFGVKPLVEIFQTIVHEQTHLWQALFGTPSKKTYHNTEWAEKMESIGLMPSDTGRVGGKKTGQNMADYPIAGGLFLAVSNELHAQGSIVVWYDRFKPKNVSIQGMLNDKNFAETLISNVADSLLTVPHLTDNMSDSYTSIIIQEESIAINNKPIKDKPITSKNKFTCSCGENLWGKVTLEALCKKCKTDFVLVKNET